MTEAFFQPRHSVSDIGQMRKYIAAIMEISLPCDPRLAELIELRLQTYILNGTTIEELAAAAQPSAANTDASQ